MRLIEKIILLFLGISLLPLLLVSTIFYSSVNISMRKQINEHLNNIATIQEHRLIEIRNHNLSRLSDFTSRIHLRNLLNTYTSNAGTAQIEITAIIVEAKSLGKDVNLIAVTDPNGKVIASTAQEHTATLLPLSELFKSGIKENTIKLTADTETKNNVFYLSGPIKHADKTLGVVIIEINANELTKTLADHTGFGRTGEIYLGQRLDNGQLSFLTPRRFENPESGQIITQTNGPMYKALTNQEGIFPNITDYRNQKVIATTRAIDGSGWGLVSKIDSSEAFQPLKNLRNELIMLFFVNSVIVVFAAIALARRFTQPILEIDEVAEIASRGKLDKRVASTSKDEIGSLAHTFNKMLDNMEIVNKAKNDFVSLASHQLRTPLTSIKWSAELLTAPKSSLSKTKQKQYLQQIYDSNERMIELVESLLNVSKIDVDSLPSKRSSVDLADKLEQVLTDLSSQIRTREISINKKIDEKIVPITIDPNWIRIILQNLISNAVRYSEPKQQVYISIEKKQTHVLIKVKDNGCGIPASQQDVIFTKFFRADNAKRVESEGSGIGLYLTKAMIERSGGTIWFESGQNKGSTFYVKIPVANKSMGAKESKRLE